ncbi:MAG: CoA pyrophosphatase [Actinomycetota bacterium]
MASELRRIGPDDLRAALAEREPGVLLTGVPARPRDAAVLAPFYVDDDGELTVVLTRRSPRLRSHTHQVSFPGGSRDEGEELVETALREAEEEVALDPTTVEIVGELDRLHTYTSGSMIVPFVGLLPGRPELVPSPAEVERIIHVAVSELTSDEVHREEIWPFPEAGERPVHFFELDGDTVWGATAAMLRQLLLTVYGLPETSPHPLTP